MAEEVPYVCEDGTAFGRYRVESKSNPSGWHLVDLTDRGGYGSCSCTDFGVRANGNYKRLGFWIPYAKGREGRSDCLHLHAAKALFYETITVPMLKAMRAGVPKPETKR